VHAELAIKLPDGVVMPPLQSSTWKDNPLKVQRLSPKLVCTVLTRKYLCALAREESRGCAPNGYTPFDPSYMCVLIEEGSEKTLGE
jgi:hypothetical protein